jgi:hypothetical protein
MEDEKLVTPRPLTPEELALLNWLLEHGLPEAKTFAPQLENIRATPWCDCGCPSISLHVEEGLPLGISSYSPIADFVGKTQDGKKVGLLLFQKHGKLDLLEEYELDVMEGDWGFPVMDSLEAWQRAGHSFQKIGEKWVALS